MALDPIDHPGKVRRGEEIDLEALSTYLREECPELVGKPATLQIEQFGAGYSNLTYLVTAGDREMVLRRPPFGSKVATAHDMGREHQVLSLLHPVWHRVPRPLAFCDDASVLGAPFYLMERVRGIILRRDLPPGLRLGRERARRLSEAFIDTLADLHGLDVKATGLAVLGRAEGYVERQVRGWVRRYYGSQTDEISDLEQVGSWLTANLPPDTGTASLVHNDFKYDNLVIDPQDPSSILAVLDWEMATIGDPLLDLGTTLGYWVEAADPVPLLELRFGPTHLPGSLTRHQIAERYMERFGRDLPNLGFYHAFGLFKIAVIAQQIYYRYVEGLTRDPRFAALIQAIRALGRAAAEVAGSGRV